LDEDERVNAAKEIRKKMEFDEETRKEMTELFQQLQHWVNENPKHREILRRDSD